MFERYAQFVISRPYLVLLAVFILVLVLAARLPQLTVTPDMRVFFSDDNPQLQAFELTEATYGRQDNVFFYIAPRQGDVFNKKILSLVHELTELGWQFPYSTTR